MATTRYRALRKKLDQLGYRQSLSQESMCLVEKLVVELERLQASRNCRSPTRAKLGKLSKVTDPSYRFETLASQITQLTKENNKLHQALMKQTEAFELRNQELRSNIRKLEHESSDVQFLNNQYLHKIRTLERLGHSKDEKIFQLQGRDAQAVIYSHGQPSKKHGPAFRRQKMEIGNCLSPCDDHKESVAYVHVDDPYIANMLEVADKRISQLQKDLQEANAFVDELKCSCQNFQQQLGVRDCEIDRLTRQMNQNHELMSSVNEFMNKRSYEKDSENYASMIEKLERENQELRMQMQCVIQQKEASESKIFHLSNCKSEMEKELQNLRLMIDQIQEDKARLLRTSTQELGLSGDLASLTCEKEKLDEQIKARDTTISRLENENSLYRDNVSQLNCMRKDLEDEIFSLKQMLNFSKKAPICNKSTKRPFFTQFNDNMTEIQRQFGCKCDHADDFQSYSDDIHPHPPFLREDRQSFRSRQKLSFSKPPPATAFGRRAITPPPRWHSKDARFVRSRSPSPVCQERVHLLGSRPHNSKPVKVVPTMGTQRMKSLKEERDYYQQCYEMLRAREDRVATPPTRDSNALEQNMHELTKERDELKRRLSKFEVQNNEFQRRLKDVMAEREQFQHKFRETENERRRLEQEQSSGKAFVERSTTRRLERENDQVCQDLQTVALERDMLRDKLKLATETQIQERKRLENQVYILRTQVEEMEKQCSDMCNNMTAYKGMMTHSEEHMKQLENELADARDEIGQEKASNNQLKNLLEQAQLSFEETKHALQLREASGIENYAKEMEEELRTLTMRLREQTNEMDSWRRNVSALDREKDQLQAEVDLRTEKLAAFDETLRNKDRIINDLKITINTLEVNFDKQREDIVYHEKEIHSLHRHLESSQKEVQSAAFAQNGFSTQVQMLQEDLATMTRENQRLHADLDLASNEKQQLKLQIQNYISEVGRIEELLREKDQERADLLDQFRNVTHEASSLESQNNHLESETATIRVELHAKNIEVQHLQTVLGGLQEELEQYIGAQQTLELELSQMRRTITALDKEHDMCKTERDNVQDDFNTVKALLSRVELDKEQLGIELARKETECDRFQNELCDIQKQLDVFQMEVQEERAKSTELETLLSETRHKDFQTQLSVQEISADLRTAQDQLADNETQLLHTKREVMQYRSKVEEMEIEMERCNRHLTNERFEKERYCQELRKLQVSQRRDSTKESVRTLYSYESRFISGTDASYRLRSGIEESTSLPEKRSDDVYLQRRDNTSSEAAVVQKSESAIITTPSYETDPLARITTPSYETDSLARITTPSYETDPLARITVPKVDATLDTVTSNLRRLSYTLSDAPSPIKGFGSSVFQSEHQSSELPLMRKDSLPSFSGPTRSKSPVFQTRTSTPFDRRDDPIPSLASHLTRSHQYEDRLRSILTPIESEQRYSSQRTEVKSRTK